MELSSPTNTSSATTKNEAENETPTLIRQPNPLSFSNGVLKRHHHHPLHHHHAVIVTYKECLKNHAATMGGYAVDGCGEFMPAANTNTNDPTSLKCAACGCHRNFHRREPEDPITPPPPQPPSNTIPALEYHPLHRHHPPPPPPPLDPNSGDHSCPSSPSPPPISSSYFPPPPHMLLSLSSAAGTGFPGGTSVENNKNSPPPHMLLSLAGAGGGIPGGGFSGYPTVDNNKNTPISAGFTLPESYPHSRKRYRTKFTQDQKEKMVEFAEKVGWRFQRKDEEIITRTCNEVGIDKGVLKVWMHNNKNTLGKKDHNFDKENARLNGNGNGFDDDEYHHHQQQQQQQDGGGATSNNNNDGRSLNQLHQLLSNADTTGVIETHEVPTTTPVNGFSSS